MRYNWDIVDQIWIKHGKPLIEDLYFLLIYNGPPIVDKWGTISSQFETTSEMTSAVFAGES